MACVLTATTRAPRSSMFAHASDPTLTVTMSPTCGAADARLRNAPDVATRGDPKAARAAWSPARNRARLRSLSRMPNDISMAGPQPIVLAVVASGAGDTESAGDWEVAGG